MRRQSSHGNTDQMIAAFQAKVNQLGGGFEDVNSATAISAAYEADDPEKYVTVDNREDVDVDPYITTLVDACDEAIQNLNKYDSWTWEHNEESDEIDLTCIVDDNITEYAIPLSDLTQDEYDIEADVDYILTSIDDTHDSDNVYSATSIEANRNDLLYFGESAAKQYGNLVLQKLAGKTVSKRRDLAEQPGGLIYEANVVGIDMWDLLEALEGMCHDGRAREIDDSTYKVKGNDRQVDSATTVNNTDDIFMLMSYSSDPESGMDGDSFDAIGKFFAADLDDAHNQLESARRSHPDFFVSNNPYSNMYVDKFNPYFDDGEEVYSSLQALMDDYFNYTSAQYDDNGEIIFNSTSVTSGTSVAINPGDEEIVYEDPQGMFGMGEPDSELSLADIKEYWNNEYDNDPSLQEYDSFDTWWADTKSWLRDIQGGCNINCASNISRAQLDAVYDIAERYNTSNPVSGDRNKETEHEFNAIVKEVGITPEQAKAVMIGDLGFQPEDLAFVKDCNINGSSYPLDDMHEEANQNWTELEHKQVPDSDGFMTEYTLYQSTDPNADPQYICMFGDRELYPADADFADAEFDTEDEARDWFDCYQGLDDDIEGATSIDDNSLVDPSMGVVTLFPNDMNEMPTDFNSYSEAQAYGDTNYGRGNYTIENPM